ncbi:Hypothetical protein CpMEX30_2131 [Corynebacterium pseudotuberculosis]|uniref:Uncharacterized protein n=2 Tax=Corynebacterium pseudotuberculosis TaxID=1719 RepID=F9Y386_CORP2|nr:hypothetical protein CPFRC_10280 [Corynebacterium pseudotuberculosis FRC41]AEK49220.1 hypothetical protein CP1002_10260 [Corynebacterium pseudotuberculosis 1002]AEK49284.1 hypothetical protein CPC231_10265 [Corynebacterium pseudotuberculosis C231]AEK93345.1 Hypothetical protein CpPAT10_2038a [Corynebacterium pseudotuberculosis PAT10]AEQ07553.1 hypothetical protein CPCIP5297_10505 [Corynebacterium pseudotuberculosis CIP 52.97]AER24527.1 hypothetical protein CPI19_10285 [Corynebacterium pseud
MTHGPHHLLWSCIFKFGHTPVGCSRRVVASATVQRYPTDYQKSILFSSFVAEAIAKGKREQKIIARHNEPVVSKHFQCLNQP